MAIHPLVFKVFEGLKGCFRNVKRIPFAPGEDV